MLCDFLMAWWTRGNQEEPSTGNRGRLHDSMEERPAPGSRERTKQIMNSRRDYRSSRSALFDGVEEGGLRAFSSYSTHEISEIDNDRAIDGLHDRVNLLKRLTGDIHEEVESHNKILNRMGNSMDISRGVLSVTMDRFRMVFQTKSTRRMTSLVVFFVVLFLLVYYLTK